MFFVLSANFCLADETPSIEEKIGLKVYGITYYDLARPETEKWLEIKTKLVYNPNYRSEIENTDFCQYKKSIICQLTFSTLQEKNIQKKSDVKVDRNMAEKFLDDLARKVNRDPQNAKFSIEDGRVAVFAMSEKGIALNKEKSLELLVAFLEKNDFSKNNVLELPIIETEPEVSMDNIDSIGIRTLIGQGKSNFKGSPKNRIHNIHVGANRFNGVLIKPGEEFSFVSILGEVDGEHGYLPELVIKHNKTEAEFGGGICQVSTTAFRAAIYSGLKITARKNHAYPVAYYNPQGMDSTVYIPRPDLRFKNNTPGYILIQTKIEGTELTFDFYGTDDGRKIEVDGPKILERKPDGSMKTTFTQKVLDKDGVATIEDIFNSSYDSPDKYPHPGQTPSVFSEKPNGWSDKEWSKYKKENNI